MDLNSLMVLKSNHCYQRNGEWKAWCDNRPVTRKVFYRLHLCRGGLTFWNSNKHHCFIVVHI